MGKPTPALFALTTLAAGLANTTANVLQDGKVSWAEIFQFAPHAMRAANNTAQYKAAFLEIEAGLDEEQLDALRDHVAQQVNFADDQAKVEQFVETCINSVFYSVKLVYDAMDLRNVDGLELGGAQARGGLTVEEAREGESVVENQQVKEFREAFPESYPLRDLLAEHMKAAPKGKQYIDAAIERLYKEYKETFGLK